MATTWRSRTVEGDLGMRWDATSVVDAVDVRGRRVPRRAGLAVDGRYVLFAAGARPARAARGGRAGDARPARAHGAVLAATFLSPAAALWTTPA